MLKAIAWGIAVGAGLQAWRQFPPDGPMTPASLWVVLLVAVVCAYLAGRWTGRGRSSATATATATATAVSEARSDSAATVNLAFVMPGQGAGSTAVARRVDSLPWMGEERPMLDADQLDGLDFTDAGLVEDPEAELH